MSQGSPIREDGEARTDAGELCPVCRGNDGHHHLHCPEMGRSKSQEKRESVQRGATPAEKTLPDPDVLIHEPADEVEDAEFDEHKIPPTGNDVQSSDMLWLVAKICHEVNRVYCQSIADWSQPEWDDAPGWQRESAYKGVTMHFENPEATPQDSHKSWLAEKEADGWSYGPVKDEEAKTHPCFVPYNQLPPAQQYKDELFAAVCKSMFGGGA